MTPESVGPLSRPVSVARLPEEGLEVAIAATAEERSELARDFNVEAIPELRGVFRLRGSERRVHVEGRVSAKVTQICVVTLEPFDSDVEEDVKVEFAPPAVVASENAGANPDHEPPDEITDGQIDVGALTAEFLALALDPYPRKPGVSFSFESGEPGAESPFTGLKKLKGQG
jgi:uncharacterized metal-binding protein YceD (DUF177 family)